LPKDYEELLDDLRRREVHIDCVQMDLVRASDGKIYSGTGYIRQKATHDFEIKMYAKGKLDLREIFFNFGSTKAGVLYKEGDHFALTASDKYHRAWRADRIINPDPDGHVEREGFIVTANCNEIALTQGRSAVEKVNWVKLRSFETIKFPCNTRTEVTTTVGKTRSAQRGRLNAAEFDSFGLSFCFEDDEGLSVSASAGEARLPLQLERRITETVTFALGIVPRWAMVMQAQGEETVKRFRNHDELRKRRTQWPPYKIELIDETGSVWRMFDLYLAHVIKDQVALTHALSRSVFGVSETRTSSIEGQALAAAVAVESILDEFYASVGKPDVERLKALGELIAYLKSWGGDTKLIDRVLGVVSSLKRARPDDRLRVLVAEGTVGEAERKAWNKLRNTVAHGNWHVYEGKLQELLDITHKVVGLFNQLVFHLISYKGKQTDYGTHGWLAIEYPPEPSAAPGESETKGDE